MKGNVKRSKTDAAFVLSDHADWNGLLDSIKATNAKKVFVTHGFQAQLVRYLNSLGVEAHEVQTEFGTTKEED
ncbi:MAG: MBL fold metallo-hydrolase RNA specificity domain-containing protein [Bacteroidia bacterium]